MYDILYCSDQIKKLPNRTFSPKFGAVESTKEN